MYKFCIADSIGNQNLQAHLVNQLQGFELNPEIYNFSSSGMELIGFPSKNLNQENSPVFWNGFSNKFGNHVGSPSSFLKGINGSDSSSESYKHGLTGITDSSMVSPEKSFVDFSSLRCVFPCEGNERPGKGLSLSLSSSNPSSSMGLQSFGIRQEADLRFDPSNSRSVNIHRQHYCMMPDNFQFGNSKFLGPTQELLNELCNLGTNKAENSKQKIQKTSERQDENVMSKQSLHALDQLELQKRTTKLLQMLQEVGRRYKHYYDQMKAVVSSFEAVAGNGAASVYSALASRAMSKHFRCLKDGIVSQMKATEKAMGDKNSAVTGTSKGETPRLRLLDQALRQQRAFQQTSMMENHPWRPRRGLPEKSVSVLREWLFKHFLHPYPNNTHKVTLARQTGLSKSQASPFWPILFNSRLIIYLCNQGSTSILILTENLEFDSIHLPPRLLPLHQLSPRSSTNLASPRPSPTLTTPLHQPRQPSPLTSPLPLTTLASPLHQPRLRPSPQPLTHSILSSPSRPRPRPLPKLASPIHQPRLRHIPSPAASSHHHLALAASFSTALRDIRPCCYLSSSMHAHSRSLASLPYLCHASPTPFAPVQPIAPDSRPSPPSSTRPQLSFLLSSPRPVPASRPRSLAFALALALATCPSRIAMPLLPSYNLSRHCSLPLASLA
ncbi:uncharacterized protein LOC142541780 [Primulina tabacum]|uniref:uncharacterized protein LOC142541780 n=1 Tax=Primulina tabacum TaxID=48773 RepID=UPI003F5A9E65